LVESAIDRPAEVGFFAAVVDLAPARSTNLQDHSARVAGGAAWSGGPIGAMLRKG